LVKNLLEQNFCVPENEFYFYHTDHLGSSSWISDQDGKAVQHLQYLPFGESWIDQRDGTWNAPFTFSGKERDWETGYIYFGARYYDSDLSIWLSVDPLAWKFPSLTPYAYCNNNPIRLIDPDGMEFMEIDTDYRNQKGELLYKTNDGLNDIIIVPDRNIAKLEQKLNEANANGMINDPETNKKEMHPLGQSPTEYREEPLRGNSENYRVGYEKAYEQSYKEGKGRFSWGNIITSIAAGFSESQDNTARDNNEGRMKGTTDGKSDKKSGQINRMEPTSSFKNNPPLIRIKPQKPQ